VRHLEFLGQTHQTTSQTVGPTLPSEHHLLENTATGAPLKVLACPWRCFVTASVQSMLGQIFLVIIK